MVTLDVIKIKYHFAGFQEFLSREALFRLAGLLIICKQFHRPGWKTTEFKIY